MGARIIRAGSIKSVFILARAKRPGPRAISPDLSRSVEYVGGSDWRFSAIVPIACVNTSSFGCATAGFVPMISFSLTLGGLCWFFSRKRGLLSAVSTDLSTRTWRIPGIRAKLCDYCWLSFYKRTMTRKSLKSDNSIFGWFKIKSVTLTLLWKKLFNDA